ncbi:MAG TPA: adenosine deaminase [Acidimicrobiales bacterium]
MVSLDDYLRLLPKVELHCHFVSTMSAATLVDLAATHGVELPTTDPDELFAYTDLADFLVAFRAAHEATRRPEDFERIAYEGVRIGVESGNLRYREYFINPQYFVPYGLSYRQVMDPVVSGLRAAEADLGVGFRVIAAINRRDGGAAAVELVEQVIADPIPEVVGIGMDDLTVDGLEAPRRFAEAYELARRHGLRTCAHVGETPRAEPENVRVALDELGVDRIDHGYRIVDDTDLVARALDRGTFFTVTPVSTTICSGWTLDPDHRIAAMIRAGLRVTVATDDAMFFRTDIGREYREALPALGFGADVAARIALDGVEATWCDDDQRAALRAAFRGEVAALDAALDPVERPG